MTPRISSALIVLTCAAVFGTNVASAGKWKRCPPGEAPAVPPAAAAAERESSPQRPEVRQAVAADAGEAEDSMPGKAFISDEAPAPPPEVDLDGTAPRQFDSHRPLERPFVPPAPPADRCWCPAAGAPSRLSVAPNMIGDLFNQGSGISAIDGSIVPLPGANVGRQKIGENSSPIPRDRVFFNYSYFDNTPLARGGIDVQRFTPGFEKTFLNGDLSLEVRIPFAATQDSTIRTLGVTNGDEAELGNLTAYLKALLYDTDTYALSAGLGVALPTADDTQVEALGVTIAEIENEAVHVLPFVGALVTPTDRLFAQGFVQFDFDANGNSVWEDGPLGTHNDAALVYADLSVGYWLHRNFGSGATITGVAPLVEVHYTGSVGANDRVTGGALTVGNGDDLDLVNVVFGLTAAIHDNSQFTLGYTLPIAGSDQQFDGELRVFFNLYFGGSRTSGSHLTRCDSIY